MKKLLIGAMLATVFLTACSKKDELLLDKESKSGQIGKFTEEELGGAEGWEAMNIFREKKDSIATYSVSYDDLSISRGLWLMETTFNYDHGNFTDTTLYVTEVDTFNFNISLIGEGTHLGGTGTLSKYLLMEAGLTDLSSGFTLILADFEFIETKDGRAFFRAIRAYGVSGGIESAPPPARAVWQNYPECTSGSGTKPAWERINPYLYNPYFIGTYGYFSNFQTVQFYEGHSFVPQFSLFLGDPASCISDVGFRVTTQEVVNDYAETLSSDRRVVSRWLWPKPHAIFNYPNYYAHYLYIKTAKVNLPVE